MTESSCVITFMNVNDVTSGHVGAPNAACEVKLVDVPEMNCTSYDQPYPRGEICVRGPIVFQGYYKDEVQTREVIDEEVWLHTGDIGLWSPGGRLKIIDRKKNIFKLAQGEYIAPEKIESVYAKCNFVAQCFVYGDSFNSSLVAIVCVDPDMLKAWAAKEGIKFESLEQLCNDPRARKVVLADMDAVGKEAQITFFPLTCFYRTLLISFKSSTKHKPYCIILQRGGMGSDNSNWHFELKYDRRVALPVAGPWPIAHYKHGVVVIDEKLYTVGGCRDGRQLADV
ncbi:putative long-chain-fatty-acid--CoA ligase [Helianthus annuus]|uniref:Long-chain-fatty-acid--CoA ligase n=1 Tax=Helianthus annuus TaxID=4232 RepID=A0A9K3IPM7_HELAN|nr:putative long-chain-fatty-acid--CoA ligase [Helianthus annuus]KAJ0558530.1 putative long-chain-fatty-acid--CoA ligase [Helianthus annuus]